MNKLRVLVLAPHPDDGELGAGGTIAKHVAEGDDVYYVGFSPCHKSMPFENRWLLFDEMKKATAALGIKSENLMFREYPVREFHAHRQTILEDLVNMRAGIEPHIVFIPSLSDMHQDHETISREALRAFKFTNIFAYEMPWNSLTFSGQCFSTLTQELLNKKIEAVLKYDSQLRRGAPFTKEFIEAMARVRGVQANDTYAEAFEVVRLFKA